MPIVLRLFFKKIVFINKENIPAKGPVILASMHPNSFIDDFVLGAFSKRTLRFLARGDVFKGKIARFLLEQMFVSPVYRAMDNVKDVKKNIEAFKIYTKTLKNNGTLLIHSEGICIHEKRVRKLKKGTARIAFGAEKSYNFELGVQIVPVSMNYSNAPKVRETLMVAYGKPILVNDFKNQYNENPAIAVNEINQLIFNSLCENAVIIEKKESEATAEQCLEITRNNRPSYDLPIYSEDATPLKEEIKVSRQINALFSQKKQLFEKLKTEAQSYFDELKKYDISDKEISRNKSHLFFHSIYLLVLLPLFSLGYIANVLPVFISRKIANKVVKRVEFYGSVYIGANWLLFQIYYFILFIIAGIFMGVNGLLIIVGIITAGFWSVILRDQYKIWYQKWQFLIFKRKYPQALKQLKIQRNLILDFLNK
jgi:1-acyl-sn-glycerol-3-phosphate acyltransferase